MKLSRVRVKLVRDNGDPRRVSQKWITRITGAGRIQNPRITVYVTVKNQLTRRRRAFVVVAFPALYSRSSVRTANFDGAISSGGSAKGMGYQCNRR